MGLLNSAIEKVYFSSKGWEKLKNYFSAVLKRVASPTMKSAVKLSDKMFLRKFNLPEVHDLLKTNPNAAKKALLAYYGNRKIRSWPSFPDRIREISEINDQKLYEKAECLLAHRFLLADEAEVCFKEKIDWQYDPTPDPKKRWCRELNRHYWWAILATAFQRSGDERYAFELVNIISDWISKVSPPKVRNEKHVAWTLMGVGIRCVVWTSVFGVLLSSKNFTDSVKFRMLQSIFDHAQFLYLFHTNNNHLLRESNGLAYIGVFFPEFINAKKWSEIAYSRIEKALIQQVNQDGSHFELSIGYQWLAIEEFEGTQELFIWYKSGFSQVDLRERLKKMYSFLGFISRPDGSLPQLNDGFMDRKEVQLQRLTEAGKKYGSEALLYIGSSGKEGAAPTQTSIGFKDAGLYVMRSDWSKKGLYLLFDSGPFGGFHGHEDKLSIELFAYGVPFIVDPGTYTYNKNDPYRTFFVSSAAHNTLTIEGKSQARRLNSKFLNPSWSDRRSAVWISNNVFDYVEGDYIDGYANYRFGKESGPKTEENLADSMVHSRTVIFVKNRYWLIIDKINTSELKNIDILFHLDPSVNFNIEGNKRAVLFSGDVHLRMVPESQRPLTIKGIFGSETPIQGWYSERRNHKVPSGVIIFKTSCSEEAEVATLLYPGIDLNKDKGLNFDVKRLADDLSCEFVVDYDVGRDVIRVVKKGNSILNSAIIPPELIAIERFDSKGKLCASFEWHSVAKKIY